MKCSKIVEIAARSAVAVAAFGFAACSGISRGEAGDLPAPDRLSFTDNIRGFKCPINQDECRARAFAPVDVLKKPDGGAIVSAFDWLENVKPRAKEFFAREIYGAPIPRPQKLEFRLVESGDAPNAAAVRRQFKAVASNGSKTFAFDVLVYIPKNARGKVPAFVLPNFYGNHAFWNDSAVALPDYKLHFSPKMGIGKDGLAKDSQRGVAACKNPVDDIVSRGYAIATFCYEQVCSDTVGGAAHGVYNIYDFPENQKPAIRAWAWANSRVLDLLQTLPEIDAGKVAVIGHSRLGKTAIYSGVFDERFAAVISNDSGCFGAAPCRRDFGENVSSITRRFGYWFLPTAAEYAGREGDMPFDQPHLLACVAPRPLKVASASRDFWADPRGEYLSLLEASKVYALFGCKRLPQGGAVFVQKPFSGDVAHHVREGKHDITKYDWNANIDWLDIVFGRNAGAK